MLFQASITIPAQTPVTEPLLTRVTLGPGTIRTIRAEFPFGCAELAGILVRRELHQIWPVTAGEYVAWENDTVEFPADFPLLERPYEVTVEAVNYDLLHSHTITVNIDLTPQASRAPGVGRSGLLEALR